MKGAELKRIRERLELSEDEFALELGYRGTARNNNTLINRYENDRKQIPLTVASLAWLIDQYFHLTLSMPDWPEWPGYERDLEPINPDKDHRKDHPHGRPD